MSAPASPAFSTPPNPAWILSKLSVLPVALAIVMLLGASFGPVTIALPDVLGIIVSQLGLHVSHAWSATDVAIVWDIRLPEVVTAVLVGAALSLSGAVFQAILRNPLADPFVIGTSSGAAFAVALAGGLGLATSTWLGFGIPQLFAFGGAMIAVALVFAISLAGRRSGAMTFLLAGFAVSTLMIAGMWLVAFQDGQENMLLGWMMGSLANASWTQLTLVAPVILGLCVLSLYFVRDLNALLLGEEQAGYLGLHSVRSKSALIVIASILTAMAVSLAGIIGFVGLVIPHIGRLIYGANHRTLLIATAFLGSIFLVLCDLAARTLEPAGGVLPLGILTAIIGAPVFIVLLLRMGDSYAF